MFFKQWLKSALKKWNRSVYIVGGIDGCPVNLVCLAEQLHWIVGSVISALYCACWILLKVYFYFKKNISWSPRLLLAITLLDGKWTGLFTNIKSISDDDSFVILVGEIIICLKPLSFIYSFKDAVQDNKRNILRASLFCFLLSPWSSLIDLSSTDQKNGALNLKCLTKKSEALKYFQTRGFKKGRLSIILNAWLKKWGVEKFSNARFKKKWSIELISNASKKKVTRWSIFPRVIYKKWRVAWH